MSDAQLLRPRYFQGEYLGPEDLTAAVDHARWARARHDLGAHAWGSAAGLGLREVPALEGGVDVFVEPGYAVDGLGRPLSVAMPTAVPLARLQGLNAAVAPGQTSVRVAVWLRYTESGTAEPGSVVRLSEGPNVLGTAVASGGSWSFTLTFAEGSHSLKAGATDVAGNTDNSSPLVILVDATAPTIAGSPDRPANGFGWYNADVTAAFSVTDAST